MWLPDLQSPVLSALPAITAEEAGLSLKTFALKVSTKKKKRMKQSGDRTLTRGPVCKHHNAIYALKSSVTGTVQQGRTVRRVLSNDRL